MLKSLLLIPNNRTTDYLSIVAIAKAECLKKEQGQKVKVRAIAPVLIWEGGHEALVYVVVYEGVENSGVGSRKRSEK